MLLRDGERIFWVPAAAGRSTSGRTRNYKYFERTNRQRGKPECVIDLNITIIIPSRPNQPDFKDREHVGTVAGLFPRATLQSAAAGQTTCRGLQGTLHSLLPLFSSQSAAGTRPRHTAPHLVEMRPGRRAAIASSTCRTTRLALSSGNLAFHAKAQHC